MMFKHKKKIKYNFIIKNNENLKCEEKNVFCYFFSYFHK